MNRMADVAALFDMDLRERFITQEVYKSRSYKKGIVYEKIEGYFYKTMTFQKSGLYVVDDNTKILKSRNDYELRKILTGEIVIVDRLG